MIDESLLDDLNHLSNADPGQMFAAVASSGAQMRQAVASVDRDALARIADGGKPRALVVAGMGGSGVSGDVLAAVAGPSSSIPVTTERNHIVPGWVSQHDMVIAVSCSGGTEETLAFAQDAGRRGARLVTVGAAGSALAQLSEQFSGSVHLNIDAQGRMPRASLWTIATPLLEIAAAIDVAEVTTDDFEVTADLMDAISVESGLNTEFVANRAKQLGLSVAESVPMIWGTGAIGRAVTGRFMAQLAENAKLPAIHGGLPEVGHNQIVTFDGPMAGSTQNDIFADGLDGSRGRLLHLVLMRDEAEHPAVARRVEVVKSIVAERAFPMTELHARGTHRLTRMASLAVLTDWASVYAAVALGIDPTPIGPIDQLKAGLRG